MTLLASTAVALPPNSTHREGANHHVGDDSFAAKFGRPPDSRDDEPLRMRTHLEHVRAVLASAPATKPELAAKRAELLGYLDDYIAKGITPENRNLPWRTPVFIDDRGVICAVGYLIERSVGRALPERIAAAHRFEFLEDIARAMPEVRAWIEGSGMTLDELASIQPGYIEPDADTWHRWDVTQIPDGPYERAREREGGTTRGTFRRDRMEGEWTRHDDGGKLVGKGELKAGSGAWTSYYADGKRLAEGRFVANHPHGAWKFFHASGNVAAEGSFRGGHRSGKWQFFHDTPARTPIAIGAFRGEHVTGKWKHFDSTGTLIATSRIETPSQWGRDSSGPNTGPGSLLTIVPGADKVRHQIHVGTVDQERQQLDTFSLGHERVYVHSVDSTNHESIYDAAGFRLEHVDGTWQASDCGWATRRKQIARDGELARLHGLLFKEARGHRSSDDGMPECGPAQSLEAERGKRLDALLASREQLRAISPAFVRDAVLGETDPATLEPDDRKLHEDLVRVLTEHMSFYIEWPHIDGRFIAVYRTVPGHVIRYWHDQMMEANVEE